MSFHWKQWILCSLVAAFGWMTTAATAHADDEFGDNTPYYEDDAWCDISEWFDGNDYNPTDESIGVWDDETYDIESETGADDDNDLSSYDYDSTYDYYDYEYDDYNSDRYLNNNSSSYGYDDRYDNDNWFYDYYDDGYAYYSDLDDDGLYDYTYNYYDNDGDGLYDEYFYYHDFDGDGLYDYTTVYTFNDSSENRQKSDKQSPSSSKRYSVNGKVAKTKKVSVRDTKHLLVQLQGSEGSKGRFIDLGPASKLNDIDIEEGDSISAQGPVVQVKDRNVMIAEKVKANGNSKAIKRDTFQVKGEIVDMRRMNVRNQKHLIAVVETTKNGKKRMVDLGPANRLEADLQDGNRVTVSGTPVKVQDQRLLLAQSLKHDGESFEIDRSVDNAQRGQVSERQRNNKSNQRSQQTRRERRVSGEVVNIATVSVNGRKRQMAIIQNDDDQRLAIDLGPAGKLQAKIAEGDQLNAQGFLTKAGNRPAMIARSVKVNGESHQIAHTRNDNPAAAKARRQRSISGNVVDTRVAKIRGQERQLVTIRTEQGQRVQIDLGRPGALDINLSPGQEVTAEGIPMKVRDQQLLVATRLERNGKSMSISR